MLETALRKVCSATYSTREDPCLKSPRRESDVSFHYIFVDISFLVDSRKNVSTNSSVSPIISIGKKHLPSADSPSSKSSKRVKMTTNVHAVADDALTAPTIVAATASSAAVLSFVTEMAIYQQHEQPQNPCQFANLTSFCTAVCDLCITSSSCEAHNERTVY